jgi:hypothetical protein
MITGETVRVGDLSDEKLSALVGGRFVGVIEVIEDCNFPKLGIGVVTSAVSDDPSIKLRADFETGEMGIFEDEYIVILEETPNE